MPHKTPSMGAEHTVRSYGEELDHLSDLVVRMGGQVEAQLTCALQALVKRDSELAGRVFADDAKIDALEHEISGRVVRLLALRQPMANDLRHVVAALKISGDLERMGDYAANVAKRVLVLNALPAVASVAAVNRIGRQVLAMIKEMLDAYVEHDFDKAIEVWRNDETIDLMYTGLVRELITYMMEDARNITACTHLMFMAKNIERIADHVTNVAELIHFVVKGTPLEADRPKGRDTAEQEGSAITSAGQAGGD